MRVGKRTVKTTHALQRQTDSVNAEGCAVLTRGAPCVNELLARVRIVSDFCFLLHSSSFPHFQSRSLAARNMPYASGSLLGAWQRALHTGLTIRAARVWPKQDTFRLCFFLQKGPQSLKSTFTWNGYSSMLSQVKTGGKWKECTAGYLCWDYNYGNRRTVPTGPGRDGQERKRSIDEELWVIVLFYLISPAVNFSKLI